MNQLEKPLLLASTSAYRKQLLQRLAVPFEVAAPVCDETALPAETPADLVQRLAQGKAESLKSRHPAHLIIGSDQVADLNGTVLGKPGTVEKAEQQLRRQSGQVVVFRTGLCLLDSASGQLQLDSVNVEVHFRALSDAEIQRYVAHDKPLDCAGSIKSEGFALSLFEAVNSSDATALVGLPLIRLAHMLRAAGQQLP